MKYNDYLNIFSAESLIVLHGLVRIKVKAALIILFISFFKKYKSYLLY